MQKSRNFRAHPWHGVSIGEAVPELVQAYIELVPDDGIKYELDKVSGILKVDRPQRFSSYSPAPYGMVPKTYCGSQTARLMADLSENKLNIKGDGDPLDILVLTEKIVPHGDILVSAKPIGGLALLDRGEADDKIISVLENDAVYGDLNDITELPAGILARIKHYFLSYKKAPGSKEQVCEILAAYDQDHAKQVIEAACSDYEQEIF